MMTPPPSLRASPKAPLHSAYSRFRFKNALLPLTALAALHAAGLPLVRRNGLWRFGDDRLQIRLAQDTGALAAIARSGQTLARDAGDSPYFDIQTAKQWLTAAGGKPRLLSVTRRTENEISAAVRIAAWTVTFHYILHPAHARLQRWARIVWNGNPGPGPKPNREILRGFWLRTPQLRLKSGGYYFFPAHWPPEKRREQDFKPGRKTSSGRSPAALIVQIAPNLSGLWASNERTPRSDSPAVSVSEGKAGALRVGQGFQCRGWMPPRRPQDVGDAWLQVLPCNGQEALHRLHALWQTFGEIPPSDRPRWLHRAVLYALHPGGTIGSQFRDLGGFRVAGRRLGPIRALGCTALWILPIEDSAVYCPRDYFKLQPGLGTPADYRAFVRRARSLGFHVLRDIVPHGGTNQCPRAKAHPEWLLRTPRQTTLSYWCFDFNWPTWIQYMQRVAESYMTGAEIDGFRVDAAYGSKIDNWNPKIPYARASFARLQGGLHMLAALRKTVKSIKPRDGAILAEVDSGAHGAFSDAVYDFRLCYAVLQDLRRRPPAEIVPLLQRWLTEQALSDPPGLLRLRHIESHDSLRSLLWYGLRPQRALTALIAWIPGIPLVYQEMEHGSNTVFRRIFQIRSSLPELTAPAMDPTAAHAPPGVFTCLRSSQAGTASIVVISLDAARSDGRIRIARRRLPERLRTGRILALDAWNDRPIPCREIPARSGKFLEFPLELPPFGFTALVLRKGKLPRVPRPPDAWSPAPPLQAPSQTPPPKTVAVAAGRFHLWLDPKTGLPDRCDLDGVPVPLIKHFADITFLYYDSSVFCFLHHTNLSKAAGFLIPTIRNQRLCSGVIAVTFQNVLVASDFSDIRTR